ncbi:MAG: GNAT family N-acetyltransferase [Turicibacter sp.]|nr:GNAT family N-acetyltransferase [Turicibacter sp.]
MQFKEATKNDAAALIEYFKLVGGESDNLLFGPEGMGLTTEQMEEMLFSLENAKKSTLFIGSVDSVIACVGSVRTNTGRAHMSHQGEIALSVQKKYWGQGWGKALLKELIQFGKASDLKALHLGVKADNPSAIRLYEKMGFTAYGNHPNFFKIEGKYFHKILMYLELEDSKTRMGEG